MAAPHTAQCPVTGATGLAHGSLAQPLVAQPEVERKGLRLFLFNVASGFWLLLWTLVSRSSATAAAWLGGPFLLAVVYMAVKNQALLHAALKAPPLVQASTREDLAAEPNTKRLDGFGNNPSDALTGGAGQPFGRNTFRVLEQDLRVDSPLPNTVADVLLNRDTFTPAPPVNLFVAAWIQFVLHDLFDHNTDPSLRETIGTQILNPTKSVPGHPGIYPNRIDHFLNGSQIYGNNKTEAAAIMDPATGKMRLQNGYLPIDPATDMEQIGFKKNIWFGLALIHYVMVLEHNAIVDKFATLYPEWTPDQTMSSAEGSKLSVTGRLKLPCLMFYMERGNPPTQRITSQSHITHCTASHSKTNIPYIQFNKLYNHARLIISALIAKIQGIEWTPAIIQNKVGIFSQFHMFYGFLGQSLRRRIGTQRWLGNFINGILGGKLDYRGVKYASTEEFAAIYRLHSLIPDEFQLRNIKNDHVLANYKIANTLFEGSHKVNTHQDKENLIYSMGVNLPGALVLNNFPTFLRNIRDQGQDPSLPNIDLASVDIIRDRERGVPRYNAFRRGFLLKPIKLWSDLTTDPATIAKLTQVYGDDVEALDLLVGTLAEEKLPGFVFGETTYSVFVAQTQRRIECDRFLTVDFRKEVYTQEGLDWVEYTSFATILRRHFPAVRSVLKDDDNAFLPWKRAVAESEE
ncbi:heme peroxidase, partial [Obelidium mucronatum]